MARRYFPEYFENLASYHLKESELKSALHQLNLFEQNVKQRESNLSTLKADIQNARQSRNTTLFQTLNAVLEKLDKDSRDSTNLTEENAIKAAKDSIEPKQAALKNKSDELSEKKVKLDHAGARVNEYTTFLWTLTNVLFVVGGMVGAFTSKYVADYLGRKKGILFHYLFVVIGAILVFIAPYINSPECVILSRFLYGVQGGMSCGLIPTYLNEISPAALRGSTGVIHQLFITIGILVSQILGFRQLLGTASCWNYLLALPIITAIKGSLFLLLFFPETPRALLINNRDEESARKGKI
jgi:membrane-associated HD superfamily phosphohydrolase